MIYSTPVYLAQEEPLPEAPLPEQLLLTGASGGTTCVFSAPVDFQGNAPTTKQDAWNFKNFNCSSTKELITNTTTGAEFYIDKTITYGDALMFWFLTIFSVGLIFSIIFKFFWRQW